MNLDIERTRFNMVEQQVRPWDVIDLRVLDVLSSVRREDFVPDNCRAMAFADVELPIGHGETMWKPVLEGRLLQALAVQEGDCVLEIGTGSGFVTACLAALAREVASVEIHADLAADAQRKLVRAGVANTRVHVADAVNGFAPGRRFDAIAVTGAVVQEPASWRSWLSVGGRMFVVLGESPAMQATLVTRVGENEYREEALFETDLSYLVHAAPIRRFVL